MSASDHERPECGLCDLPIFGSVVALLSICEEHGVETQPVHLGCAHALYSGVPIPVIRRWMRSNLN